MKYSFKVKTLLKQKLKIKINPDQMTFRKGKYQEIELRGFAWMNGMAM